MQRVKAYLDSVSELSALVAAHADRADRAGRLTDEVVGAIHRAGLYRMLIPEDRGGGGLRLTDTFPVVEAMARVDGATGWNLAIGANALGMAATIPDAEFRGHVLAEGSLVVGGLNPRELHARSVEGGVVVDGRMSFASGSPHATWLAALVIVDDGPPLVTMVPTDAAEPVDTWDVCGLRGTGSHDWILREVFVPAAHTFRVTTIGTPERDVMALLPFTSLLGPSLAFVALGVARHAIDALIDIAAAKSPFGSDALLRDRADTQIAVAAATGLVQAGRSLVIRSWQELESSLLAGEAPSTDDLARLRLASVTATRFAADATDDVQRAAGSSAVYERPAIARCWRDAHTVTQHAMVSQRHLDRVGRVLLGLPAGAGPI